MKCLIEFNSFADFPTENPEVKKFIKYLADKDKLVDLEVLFQEEFDTSDPNELYYSEIEEWLAYGQSDILEQLDMVDHVTDDYYDNENDVIDEDE